MSTKRAGRPLDRQTPCESARVSGADLCILIESCELLQSWSDWGVR
jgi:hypothetical protein